MRPKSWAPWLIAAVTFGPFVLAWLLYFGPFDLAQLPRLSGERELIEPPVVLPEELRPAALGDGPPPWALIYARTAPCNAACLEDLDRLHRVQLALGRDLDRVKRVFLHEGSRPEVPGDTTLAIERIDAARDSALLRVLDAESLAEGRVYLADPLGNLVASYPADVAQKELLRDLKRLLSVSQIG